MIAFSSLSEFNVRLPIGNNLNLIIHIRDTLDCIKEYNITSVTVIPDSEIISQLIQNSNNSIVRLLSSGNQNIIGQVLTSVSQQFNQRNIQSLEDAVSSKF